MKRIKLSVHLFRAASIVPVVLMFVVLGFAYVSNTRIENQATASDLGTVNADVTWRVRLKDNPFFPTKELGSEYSFIRELVDRLQFDVKYLLDGAPDDAVVKIKYQVDGILRASQDASGSGLLLMQEYPKLAEGNAELSAQSVENTQQFELSLTPYTYVIESFQSAYRLGVTSMMDLSIRIDAIMESGKVSISKSIPLNLTIPLDSSVFQISGSPTDKIAFEQMQQSIGSSQGSYGTTLYYLGAAVLLLLITVAVFLFFSPPMPEPETILLKQTINKCRNSLVTIKANPREAGLPMLPVADIDGLVNISESMGQPVLYYNEKDEHLFLVSSDELLYSYELKAAVKTDPGQVPTQGKAAL